MGTRHLIEVKLDGELKVAQYGQWDGYPTGQGVKIADFIHYKMDKKKFKAALRKCHWITDSESTAINDECPKGEWRYKCPWLWRDAGAEVLVYIQIGRASCRERV